jgi:hypothetical protein
MCSEMASRGGTRTPKRATSGDMNAALAKQCAALRVLLAKANADEIRTRYRVGTIIVRVQEAPKTYGTRSVEVLARALDYERTTLYRHASVARAFDQKTVDRMLAKSQRAVSWSHLVVLASVTDEALRSRLLELVLKGTSVRDLQQVASSGGMLVGATDTPASALRHLIAVTESLKGRVAADVTFDFSDSVHDREVLDLASKLVESHRELREICERKLRQYEQLHADVARTLRRESGPVLINESRARTSARGWTLIATGDREKE